MNIGTFKTEHLDVKAKQSSKLQEHKYCPELAMLLFNLNKLKSYSPGDI